MNSNFVTNFHMMFNDRGATNTDIIADFIQTEVDKIDLSLLDANAVAAGVQHFHFIGGLTFTGGTFSPEGEVRFSYDGLNDWTIVEVNLDDGGATADMAIRLVGNITLTVADFVGVT